MKEPTQGKWGLWYIEGSNSGFATREQAIKSVQDKEDAARAISEEKAKKATKRVISGVVVLAAAIWAAVWWFSGSAERAEKARIADAIKAEERAKVAALLVCQKAIASTAKYAGQNTPPYTNGRWAGGVWQFLWPQGSFNFKNGFGSEVPQSARCEIDPDTKEITYLLVSGQEIVK